MSDASPFVFGSEDFFPEALYRLACELRGRDPVAIYKATQTRQPRKVFMPSDGRLLLLAADQPARGAVALEGDPLRLASRKGLLARLVRVLLGGAFDGVMATSDVLEELCLVQQILRENGGPAFLDGKVFVASINRGGLADSVFEVDDVATASTIARAKHLNCDAVKVSLRIDLEDPATPRSLERCAQLITEANAAALCTFVDCIPLVRDASGRPVPTFDTESVARAVSIVSALGETSTRTWLRLPWFEGLPRALEAATLPVVLAGGAPRSGVAELLGEVEAAFGSCPTVRGVMMGRPILYPGGDDPLAVAAAIETVVRRGVPIAALLERLDQARGVKMDVLRTLAEGKDWRFEGGTQTASFTAGMGGGGRA